MQTKNIYKLYDYVDLQKNQLVKQYNEIKSNKDEISLQNVKINSLL